MQRLWAGVASLLNGEGRRWTLSRISQFNQASVRSHARLGAVRTGWVAALVLPPLQFSLCSGRPWVHLSFSPRQVPRVQAQAPAAE